MEENKEKRKIAPVVTSKDIVASKESAAKKLSKSFLQEDIKNVGSYIWDEWAVPMVKKGILGAIAMVFFKEVPEWIMRGDFGIGGRGSSRSYYDRASYSEYYRGRESYDRNRYEKRPEKNTDYRHIVLTSQDAANRVVGEMRGMIADRGYASVSELLELCGIEGNHVDCDWGWIRERDIGVKRVYNGFLIDVEEARYIGR